MKRPKLLISTKINYLINWSKTEIGYIFHDTFDGDIRAVESDLRQVDGFCDSVLISPPLCFDKYRSSLRRTSSFNSYPFAFGERQPKEISIYDHSV
uniref:Site-specific DNA-methyltransferase (adenine-specific) n=1 Tax=Elaeophora elaphi TaxID=1147741 RepID=A0A0R3RNV8_9BILA